MKLLVLCLVPLSALAASSGLWCRGEVPTPAMGGQSDGVVVVGSVLVGGSIRVSQAFMSDLTVGYNLIVVFAEPRLEGLSVIATDQDGSFVSFLYRHGESEVVLQDFKGFEGEFSYGPATLSCR